MCSASLSTVLPTYRCVKAHYLRPLLAAAVYYRALSLTLSPPVALPCPARAPGLRHHAARVTQAADSLTAAACVCVALPAQIRNKGKTAQNALL